jgi:hypothetical protein
LIVLRSLKEVGDTASRPIYAYRAGKRVFFSFLRLRMGFSKDLLQLFLAQPKENLFKGTLQRGELHILKQTGNLAL